MKQNQSMANQQKKFNHCYNNASVHIVATDFNPLHKTENDNEMQMRSIDPYCNNGFQSVGKKSKKKTESRRLDTSNITTS